MKSIIRDYAKICYASVFLLAFLSTSTKGLAQENKSFNLKQGQAKQIIEKYQIDDAKIYQVTEKEVDYYPYVDGEAMTPEYKDALDEVNKYKSSYDDYENKLALFNGLPEAIKAITSKVDAYLNSKETAEIKDKYLIEAKDLADKYHIEVDDIHAELTMNMPKMIIYSDGKAVSKSDLKAYKTLISNFRIEEPRYSFGHDEYIKLSQKLSSIQKTKKGRVLSDKMSKKSVYVIDENPADVNNLSGEFIELQDNYSLVSNEVTGKFIKNELITQSNEQYDYSEYYKTNGRFDGHTIIKKTSTGELYYVMSDYFIRRIHYENEETKYANLGTSVEYKTWKAKYTSLLQTAQIHVNSCTDIIKKHTYLNRLHEKMYDSNTFTKQEKISFNKNLDLLNDKLSKISELEDNSTCLSFYNEHATDKEATVSYSISTFYNNTSRVY